MDIFTELEDIGRMLDSAAMLVAVRHEVSKVAREGFVVTDGAQHDGTSKYQVVVRCGVDEENVTRRLRDQMPQIETSKIAAGVIGIRYARRVR